MALGQGKGQARDSAAIYLAAFGKHPGWDDHIEDIGIETETLATVRRIIYTECISGNIDSGAWEKLSDDQRLPAFAHEFVWWLAPSGKEPPRVIVGRLWSSRDGKGRSKYPMAVYCQGDGIPLSVMAREVPPALADVERACVEASSADAVRAAIDQARSQLRARFAKPSDSAPGRVPTPAEAIAPREIAALLDRPEFGDRVGPIREGLARAFYAVEREMGVFIPIGSDSKRSKSATRSGAEVRAAHLRLPALGSTPAQSAMVWISLLSRRLAESASILAISPRDGAFVDVVAGEPGVAHLFGMRASATGFPLTTDVPYAIDDSFRTRVADWSARWSGAEPVSAPPPPPPPASTPSPKPSPAPSPSSPLPPAQGAAAKDSFEPATSASPSSPPPASHPPVGAVSTPSVGSRSSLPRLVAVAGVVAAVGVGAWLVSRGGEDLKPVDQGPLVAGEPGNKTPDSGSPPVMPDIDTQQQRQERERIQEETRLAEQREEQDRQVRKAAEDAERERVQREALAVQKAEEDRRRLEAEQVAQRKEQEAIAAEQEIRRIEAEQAAERLKTQALAAEQASIERAAMVSTLELVGRIIAGGGGLGDSLPDGRTVRDAIDQAKSRPSFAELSDEPAVKSVLSRVSLLEQVRAAEDAEVLLRLARPPSDGSFGVVLAAAERLTDLGWPAGLSDWSAPVSLAQELGKVAGSPAPEHAVPGMAERAAAVARSMWTFQWRSIDPGDQSALAAGVLALAEMGVDPRSLESIDRYNLMVVELRTIASSHDGDVRAGANDFVTRAASLNGLPGPAQDQIVQVQAAITSDQSSAAAVPVVERLGPGSLPEGRRWSVQAGGDGWVIYAPPPGSSIYSPISFVRVETPRGASYVQSNEVSLGLFASLVDAADAWGDVARLGRIEVRADPVRQGPAVWQWDIRRAGQVSGMIPASPQSRPTSRGWFDHDNYMARVAYFEPGREPDPPSRDHPMQYVSPSAAFHVARLAGCRLPTVEEAAAVRAIDAADQPNRRDQSWGLANDFLWRRTAGRDISKWLDGGIFVPQGERPPRRDKALPAVNTDDGFIFFRPVGSTTDGFSVRDAIGNVAEFVFLDTLAQDQLPLDPVAMREAINRSESIQIVGGSALSPSEVDPNRPYSVQPSVADGGFSDVGFRLAFDATGSIDLASLTQSLREKCLGLQIVQKIDK